jgi:hypothetical protein
VQLFGHRHAEIAKRIDIAATAIYSNMTVDAVSDLDLSYTPPLGPTGVGKDMMSSIHSTSTSSRLPCELRRN